MLHAGVYLDPGVDQELIDFLKPFARRRRTGHVIREALRMYFQSQRSGGLVVTPPAPAVPPLQPTLFPLEAVIPTAHEGTEDTVIAKSKRAFFK